MSHSLWTDVQVVMLRGGQLQSDCQGGRPEGDPRAHVGEIGPLHRHGLLYPSLLRTLCGLHTEDEILYSRLMLNDLMVRCLNARKNPAA